MSFHSPFPDVHIPPATLYHFLFESLTSEELSAAAIVDGTSGRVITYGELRGHINAVAGGLSARAIGPGAVVGVLAPNVPEFAWALHGILRAGATATPVNALYTAVDIAKQLDTAGAGAVFCTAALAPAAAEAARLVGISPQRIFVMDSPHAPDGAQTLGMILAEAHPPPDIHPDPAETVAVLPFSSGTTGPPKGVMLTHTNLVANICQIEHSLPMSPTDRVLAVLPFFHIYGLTVLLNTTVRRRATVVTLPKFELDTFLRTIADQHCSLVFIAPPIAVALAKHPRVDDFDLSTVHTVVSGAAALDKQLARAVQQRLGCTVVQGFGMTEMSPVSHIIPTGHPRIPLASVGPTIANMECKIIDHDTGSEVVYPTHAGTSKPGELCCKGPNIMAGYLHEPEQTAQAIDPDGFLHTGDLATVDADGNVTIVGRLKELIKYKGYQVAPAELEAVLLTHPDILDAAAIPAEDASGQEVPAAFVVRQPEGALSAADVMAYVAARVSPHKKIRIVHFVDHIPKSAAGKILRQELQRAASRQ